MGATRWNEYRPQVEAEYEKIRKGDPELGAALYDIFKPSYQVASKDPAAWEAQWQATKARLIKAGYSPKDAQNFMMLGRNVSIAGDKPVDDLIAADGVFDGKSFTGGLPQLTPSDQLGNDDAAKDVIRADMDKFIAEMMGDVSPNDPVMKGLMAAGVDAAQTSAGAAGVDARSGLAGTQAASLGQANAMPYLAQRKSLGLQAQGLRANHELGLEGLAQGWERLDRGAEDAKWAAEQNARQAAMGAIGTGLGAIGSMYGLPVTPQMGGQFGAGLANIGDKGPQYTSNRPTYSSRNSGSSRNNGSGF